MIVVCDLNFLDEIQVHQENGWLRPIPKNAKPVTFECVVMRLESLSKALGKQWSVSPEPVGWDRWEVTPLFELILKIRID